MDKQLSDEQIDQLMRTLLSEAALEEKAVNEIADSPKLWWGVQRQITTQKAETKSPWPPAIWRRVLLFAAPAAVAAALIISFFVLRPDEHDNNAAKTPQQKDSTPSSDIDGSNPITKEKPAMIVTKVNSNKHEVTPAKPVGAIVRNSVGRSVKGPTFAKAKKSLEFKSEFIALSYARNAESGQIVRVRVPSSMMVSLGLVSSVNKSSDLVDAEVIVGDDGLTRAIRFIR